MHTKARQRNAKIEMRSKAYRQKSLETRRLRLLLVLDRATLKDWKKFSRYTREMEAVRRMAYPRMSVVKRLSKPTVVAAGPPLVDLFQGVTNS